MARLSFLVCALISCLAGALSVQALNPHDPIRRGEVLHHHSLEPPFIHDWWQDGIPHWEVGGDAVTTNDFIRLTSVRQSRFGWAWNTLPNDHPWWELKMKFYVRSRQSPGADGIGLWYVTNPSKDQPGPIFGMPSDFKGFGIIFDSYDNDNMRDNPVVSVIMNEKGEQRTWDTHRDLFNDAATRCVFDYRNTDKSDPVEVTVTYYMSKITMQIQSRKHYNPVFCGEAHGNFPPGGFFGVTASTGHVTDSHDIVSLYVRPMGDAPAVPQETKIFEHKKDQEEKEFWVEKSQQQQIKPDGSGVPPAPAAPTPAAQDTP